MYKRSASHYILGKIHFPDFWGFDIFHHILLLSLQSILRPPLQNKYIEIILLREERHQSWTLRHTQSLSPHPFPQWKKNNSGSKLARFIRIHHTHACIQQNERETDDGNLTETLDKILMAFIGTWYYITN